jgi:Putative 2OG-Fe(II) oxygenase
VIQWLDPLPHRAIPHATALALAKAGVERSPNNATLQANLGILLATDRQYLSAAAALETAAKLDAAGFSEWPTLAQCYMRLQRPNDVLDVGRRFQGEDIPTQLLTLCGCALYLLGRGGEGRAMLLRAISRGDDRELEAPSALLRMIAIRKDGGELIETCDALPTGLQGQSLVTAHRALALSMLGRSDAGGLVDLDSQVLRVAFEPPAEFGGIENFNRTLAQEILREPDPPPARLEGTNVDYRSDLYVTPAKLALRDFTHAAIETYLRAADRYLDGLPPPPAVGFLRGAHTVLRNDGCNGQHIHPTGYVSTIYYVSVPALDPDSDRGALSLGCCDEYTCGHIPSWGIRRIKPMAGTLLIFPSHIFHDVVPTGTPAPRISVVADLMPPSD